MTDNAAMADSEHHGAETSDESASTEGVVDRVAFFTRHRSLLFTVAYEITGSAGDAEDVVQDSYLRWAQADASAVRHPRAYLVQIATRQALNKLRSAARRREEYVGPWLPEPLITSPDVAEDAVLADSVSMAMLVVLDTLTPDERAVFVLREVFAFSHDEIATAVGKSAPAVRQIAHRARDHVQARRPRVTTGPAQSREVVESFMTAAVTGELQELMDLLAPDCVLLADGGGIKSAALRPIAGADKIARFLIGVRDQAGGEVRMEFDTVNGQPAAVLFVDDVLDSVAMAETLEGRISTIYLVRNPEKLDRLDIGERLTRQS